VKAEGDEQIGINIVKRAITEPLRQIVENAGEEGAVILAGARVEGNQLRLQRLLQRVRGPSQSWRARSHKGCAHGVAERRLPSPSLMLTTEALIAEIPEKKEAPAPGGHGGGMGDMY